MALVVLSLPTLLFMGWLMMGTTLLGFGVLLRANDGVYAARVIHWWRVTRWGRPG